MPSDANVAHGVARPSRRVVVGAVTAISAAVLPMVVAAPAHGAYPGANGKIAFESTRDGDLEIYVMEPDGSSQTNLTNNPTGSDFAAVWSPDGTRIAFAGGGPNDGVHEGHNNIWVMNADGSGRANLTPGAETTAEANSGVQPTWSPDGASIAYNHAGDIWVMNADGSAKTEIIEGIEPTWSPLGDKIAFIRDADVWVMSPDGSSARALAATAVAEKSPDWSPGGSSITYSVAGDIFVMSADGTGTMNLTGGTGESGVLPAFSPDGTKIAFGSPGCGAPNGPEICVMNPDGTSKTRLPKASATGFDANPSWQPVAAELPTLAIADASVAEGDSGTVAIDFVVSLSAASTGSVTATYATADGTAKAPADYVSSSGTLTFAPGETTKTVRVAVNGDTLFELDETFSVELTGAAGAAIADPEGIGTIANADAQPSIVVTDVSKAEGDSGTVTFKFKVKLSTPSGVKTNLQYATADGSATSAGEDYEAKSGKLAIPAGEVSKTVKVSVNGDVTAEPDETFFLNLTKPKNATLADSQGLGTIVNDD